MKNSLLTAAALSGFLALSFSAACAQGSNQGTPDTLHGSGDMMQDGPHASATPASATNLPSGLTASQKKEACSAKWKDAVANDTTGGRSKHDFLHECMSAS